MNPRLYTEWSPTVMADFAKIWKILRRGKSLKYLLQLVTTTLQTSNCQRSHLETYVVVSWDERKVLNNATHQMNLLVISVFTISTLFLCIISNSSTCLSVPWHTFFNSFCVSFILNSLPSSVLHPACTYLVFSPWGKSQRLFPLHILVSFSHFFLTFFPIPLPGCPLLHSLPHVVHLSSRRSMLSVSFSITRQAARVSCRCLDAPPQGAGCGALRRVMMGRGGADEDGGQRWWDDGVAWEWEEGGRGVMGEAVRHTAGRTRRMVFVGDVMDNK